MPTAPNEQENIVFITETCCAIRAQRILVNNGVTQCNVPDLIWRLLECLISLPGNVVPLADLYVAVWNKKSTVDNISQALRRLKNTCRGIGVDDEALNKAFEFISKEGVRFNPPSRHIDYSGTTITENQRKVSRAPSEQSAYYITNTCYFHREEQVLVNNGNVSKPLAGLIWDFLNYFMRHPGVLATYETISQAVWGDKDHKTGYPAQLMNRLKKEYLLPIGVDENSIKQAFVTTPRAGITFHPQRPIDLDLEDIGDALRSTGVPQDQLLDVIDCMLYRGISGRMGRESIVALAKKKNMMAALELGELYYYGYISRNHKPDYRKACAFYEQAGDHPTALWTLGYCIMNNFWPVVAKDQIDYLKARDYFEQALSITTKTGESAPAYTSLGQLWEDGHYPEDDFATTHRCKPRDINQALYYYGLADKLGYHYATNRLALHQEKYALSHPGNRAEEKKAFDLFSRSVNLVVDGYALNKLGLYYERGFGCEQNPDKACECYIRGVDVDEVLEDDITGWNLFNAGRARANRIKNQPQLYCNLPKAFDLFNDALQKLPTKDHGKVLIEMMEILSFGDISDLDPAVVKRKKYEIRYRVSLFLDEVEKGEITPDEEVVAKVKLLVENL